MARLNEPAAPMESIESLKRKFLRQNRDIARANSSQSLRIRNLENEISRLLAENLGLRENILNLQNELNNGDFQCIVDRTAQLKSELEAKLLEIGAIVTGLGDHAKTKKGPPKEKPTQSSPSRSPSQKRRRNVHTLSDIVSEQEGRLPPILENKQYPRRTLERQEIIEINANTNENANAELNSTDSPDIGPPPVSQFVCEDPVKIDLPQHGQRETTEEIPDIVPALSINLEQRRKRKDSGSFSEGSTNKPEPASDIRNNASSLKAGAKRKISVREDEEDAVMREIQNDLDDFKYTRVTTEEKNRSRPKQQPENLSNRAARELAIVRGAPREKKLSSTSQPNRKILASKSTNNSPKKNGHLAILDETKTTKVPFPMITSKKDVKERKPEVLKLKPLVELPSDTIEVLPEPETPANVDLFSPSSSSQPSTAREESRDTPPPSDIGPGPEGHRPNRRARGAVSYAEPNLRDKMRRPTKQLTDAVRRDGKSFRESMVKLEDSGPNTTVSVKPEPDDDGSWKIMPTVSSATIENSPLRNKVSIPDSLPSNITTHRKRRESLLQVESDGQKSTSATAIAALLAETRKAKAATKEKQKDLVLETDAPPASAMAKLDIYDFNEKSPAHPEDDLMSAGRTTSVPSRVSRRQSSISHDITSLDDSDASEFEASKSELSASRRRQSSLEIRGSLLGSIEKSRDVEGKKTLKRPTSSTGMAGTAVGGESRSDRISARRRSMML